MANGEDVAACAQVAGVHLFANTVTLAGFHVASGRFAAYPNVHVGAGAHPWWAGRPEAGFAPDGGYDADAFERAAAQTRFIGEVGLDLGPKRAGNREAQVDAFTAIARICARQGGKVLSLHSVKAAGAVLDALERAGALATCTCIFHWFSGSSDELLRARRAGCLFSVNPQMLATARGREYVKAIPATQLLLETDDPPGQDVPYSYEALASRLEDAVRDIARIKGEAALDAMEATARGLFAG